MANNTVTALVPIKGASERVPGKNLRSFCGKPLLEYVITMLQNTDCIKHIVVNTDSEEVVEKVKPFPKVIIHERPMELRGHQVPMNAVLAHDLGMLGEGHYLQTHVTNPLLTGETVTRAVTAYFAGLAGHDSLFSATPIQNRFFFPNGTPVNHDPAVLMNTQDLDPLYEENSCIYLFSFRSFFENNRNRVGRRYAMFPMTKLESCDIDTEEDFLLAELTWRLNEQKRKSEAGGR